MAFVRSGGREIYAERHGEGSVPLLLLHGAGSNAATWWQQLPAFAAAHGCVTMDLRCFGRSAAPMAELRYEHLLADVLAVLDHFGLQRVIVAGQSLGGMVGVRLALQHASRIAGFIACDTLLGIDHPVLHDAMARRARTAGALTLEQRALGAWFLRRDPERAALYAQINHFNPSALSVPPEVWSAAIGALLAPEQLLPVAALGGIACPTLWLVGREDPLVPLQAMLDAQAALPGSELAVLDDCGHSSYFEQPQAFNHRVLDFIARRL